MDFCHYKGWSILITDVKIFTIINDVKIDIFVEGKYISRVCTIEKCYYIK